jgi:hypothetical protein
MKRIRYRWLRVLVVAALVCLLATSQSGRLWAEWVHLPRRAQLSVNVRRHAERVARRRARWERRHQREGRVLRRRLHRCLQREVMKRTGAGRPAGVKPAVLVQAVRVSEAAPVRASEASSREGSAGQPPAPPSVPVVEPSPTPQKPDPLADLRAGRGWIDQLDERQLWAILIQVRWPHGPGCPRCGETDPHYLHLIDPDYRGFRG